MGRVSKDGPRASWFETALTRLLTMRDGHSTSQNMQGQPADLRLALWRYGRNAARQIKENIREPVFMSAMPSAAAKSAETYDVVVVGAGFAGMYMLHRLRGQGMTARVYEQGSRRRRHLVLEPLSRRALRRREHAVFLFVLRGAAAGMGLERALRAAAGDFEIRQPRRRPFRVCAPTSSSTPASTEPRSTRRLRCGRSRRQMARQSPQNSSCSPPAACRTRGCPISRGSINSRARSITPATGRMMKSISPACASASSARDRRRSSRCRSLPSRRAS